MFRELVSWRVGGRIESRWWSVVGGRWSVVGGRFGPGRPGLQRTGTNLIIESRAGIRQRAWTCGVQHMASIVLTRIKMHERANFMWKR